MKLRPITPLLFAGALFASATPIFAAMVYIDSFNQGHTGVDGAILNSSTGPTLTATTTQTLTTGTPTDAIGTTRTLTTTIADPVSLSGTEKIQTTIEPSGSQLRISNSLIADNPEPPNHTTHKIEWTGISSGNQQLLTNVGAGDVSDLQFVIHVNGASNRDPAYTANQYFDITLFSGSDTAGFRGVMTNSDFTTPGDFDITLTLFGTPSSGFNPNAVDRIVMQTNLAFTQGANIDGVPEENALLVKQITAIPEPSVGMISLTAFGLCLFRRRR